MILTLREVKYPSILSNSELDYNRSLISRIPLKIELHRKQIFEPISNESLNLFQTSWKIYKNRWCTLKVLKYVILYNLYVSIATVVIVLITFVDKLIYIPYKIICVNATQYHPLFGLLLFSWCIMSPPIIITHRTLV